MHGTCVLGGFSADGGGDDEVGQTPILQRPRTPSLNHMQLDAVPPLLCFLDNLLLGQALLTGLLENCLGSAGVP